MSGNISEFNSYDYTKNEYEVKRLEYVYPMDTYDTTDKFYCIRCGDLVKVPVKMLYCGHSMCGSCHQGALEVGKMTRCNGNEERCFQTDLTNKNHVVPSFYVEKQLKNIIVYCPNYGCEKQLKLSELDGHLTDCLYRHENGRETYTCLDRSATGM